MPRFNPKQDGIDHINIYSKGKTNLGKFLSNFTYFPFECEDGQFNSIEGYWYWLGAFNCAERERLRNLFGFEAKKLGRLLIDENKSIDIEFKNKISSAIEFKIKSSNFLNDFINSTLPFAHYYVMMNKIIEPKDCEWILDFLNNLRTQLQS